MFSHHRVFLKQFYQRYRTTGAILPSGRALARALCRYVGQHPTAARVLEVGPGTGAVTAELVRRLRPQDRLWLVELNDAFVQHLRRRFETEPSFVAVADRCQLAHGRLEELGTDLRYDLIISGLPLNNFAVEEVETILATFGRLLKPDGILSFFEYIAIRRLKSLVSRRSERRRLRGVGEALARVLSPGEIRRDWVWSNVPPAWVHHVRFAGAVAGHALAEKPLTGSLAASPLAP